MTRSKPRVMYIVRNFPQISQTYIRSEIEALQADYEISVITLTNPNVPYTRCVPFRMMSDPAEVWEAIEDFRPDVLHSHYLNQSEMYEPLIARGLNVPFTIRAHSFDTLTGDSPLARQAAPVINHELCLGVLSFPFTRPILEAAGIASEKIVDSYPVVNYPMFYDRSPNGEAVMNIGAAIPKKRMEDFVDLAAQLPGIEFDLYAVGHIVHQLHEYNASKGTAVKIMPPIEPDEMPREYKKHRWLVYTASRELATVGWPMAVAEAQAAGVGVCMPNLRPDLKAYVGDAGYIYDSIAELPGIVTKPVPDEMRELGFQQAKKSDIFEHKRVLTDIWKAAF
ncbi:MAG: hypothetical protein QOJ39_2047 [Candidatus Eremiobacteraeota bacterium]|jgi:hypothetical protein|nr:hypothetical protein [Candidatus Eremiobacteraeota bacterium]